MYLHGMPVIESSNLISGYKTIPKKRNKNKRIQKKWNKKYGYYFVPIPDTNIYYFDGMYGGHPKTIKKIMKIIKKEVKIMPKVNCSFVVCKHNSECDNSSAGILGVCNCKDDISLNYFDVTIGYNDEIEVDDSKIKTDVADEWKESGVVSGLSCNNFIFGRGRKNNA